MSTAINTVVNAIMVEEKLSLDLFCFDSLKELIEFNVYVYYELAFTYQHQSLGNINKKSNLPHLMCTFQICKRVQK